MDIDRSTENLAKDQSQALIQQLNRLRDIMNSLTETFEDIVLQADAVPDYSVKIIASAVLNKVMKGG